MMISREFTLAGHLQTVLEGPQDMPMNAAARSDEEWMVLALQYAMCTMGLSQPNPTVGALVVKAGRIIGMGSSQATGGHHAERMALTPLLESGEARGATVYSTLEPCSHQGRQPPCCDIIIRSGISRVVAGASDSNPLVNGKGNQWLRDAGIAVKTDVLRDECTAWHLPFLSPFQLKRPLFAAKWAQTLDGKLALTDDGPSKISGASAFKYSHWLRQRYDAILIGAGTALKDLPMLNVRRAPFEKFRDPIRVICDPRKRILEDRNFLEKADKIFREGGPIVYLVGDNLNKAEEAKCFSLEQDRDVVVRLLPADKSWVEAVPAALSSRVISRRTSRTIGSVLVEGGPTIHSLFLKNNLLDVAHVYVAPFVGSGPRHRVSAMGSVSARMQLAGAHKLDDDCLLEFINPQFEELMFSGTKVAPEDALEEDLLEYV